MRRMSTWVVGVPLPGMKILCGEDDIELAVDVDDIALAERLAMTFTITILDLIGGGGRGFGRAPYRSSRPMPVFLACHLAEVNVPKTPPFWSAGISCRPPAFLAGPQPHCGGPAGMVRDAAISSRSRRRSSGSPGNETHLHAFATDLIGPGGERRSLYLHTSPEFACKKLLAAGETRIVDFARVFRNRERGALHHPEFTMLEWYRDE